MSIMDEHQGDSPSLFEKWCEDNDAGGGEPEQKPEGASPSLEPLFQKVRGGEPG